MRHAFIILSAVCMLFIISCQEKEKVGILDDSFKPVTDEIFNRFIAPESLNIADSATVKSLLDEFAPEREALSNQFKSDNPVLWGEYQDDCKAAANLTDKKQVEDHFKAMSAKYKSALFQSFKNLNMDKSAITARAKNILGNIPFTLGNFNEIIITAVRGEDQIALPAAFEVNSATPYALSWYTHSHGLPHSEPPFIDNGTYYSFVNALLFMKVVNGGVYSQKSDVPASYSKLIVEYPSISFTENINLFCTGGGAESSVSVYGTMDFYNGTQFSGTGTDVEIYRKQVIAIAGGIYDLGDIQTNTDRTRRSWLLNTFPVTTNKIQTGYKISVSTEAYGFSSSSAWSQAVINQPVYLRYYN